MPLNALGNVFSKVLAANKAFIEENLVDVKSVLEILCSNGILSIEQREVIVSGESDSDKTCRLTDILIRLHPPNDVFKAFCEALKSANYANIHDKLLFDCERYDVPASNSEIDHRTEQNLTTLGDKCDQLLMSTRSESNANISPAERDQLLEYVREQNDFETLVDCIAHNSVSPDVIMELKGMVDGMADTYVSSSSLTDVKTVLELEIVNLRAKTELLEEKFIVTEQQYEELAQYCDQNKKMGEASLKYVKRLTAEKLKSTKRSSEQVEQILQVIDAMQNRTKDQVRLASKTNTSKRMTKNDIMPSKDIDLHDLLSEGGTCKVYSAAHKMLKSVAVKKLKQDMEKVTEFTDFHIRREARCLARLSHPHIVQFHGLIWEPNYHAIVLEYIEEDLSTCVKRHRPHDWIKTKLLCDVARGVSYLHWLPKQIIHNDLKATNVLVNDRLVAKVCDFGLANWQSCSTLLYRNTNDDQQQPRGGTQTHISPERFEDVDKDSTKSDVYSFAILMWETFSEKRPFANCRTGDEIKRAVLNGNRPSPRYLPDDVISELVCECWRQRAADRPDMNAVLHKLEAYLSRPEVVVVVHEYTAKLMLYRSCVQSAANKEKNATSTLNVPSIKPREGSENSSGNGKNDDYTTILSKPLQDCVDKNGRSLLHGAAIMNDLDKVKFFASIPVDKTDNDGNTALHGASENGHRNIVQYLIEHRSANVKAVNNAGCTALHLSCKMKHHSVTKYLLQETEADVYAVDKQKYTPMHYACESGCAATLMLLRRSVSAKFLAAVEASLVDIANKNEHTELIYIIKEAPDKNLVPLPHKKKDNKGFAKLKNIFNSKKAGDEKQKKQLQQSDTDRMRTATVTFDSEYVVPDSSDSDYQELLFGPYVTTPTEYRPQLPPPRKPPIPPRANKPSTLAQPKKHQLMHQAGAGRLDFSTEKYHVEDDEEDYTDNSNGYDTPSEVHDEDGDYYKQKSTFAEEVIVYECPADLPPPIPPKNSARTKCEMATNTDTDNYENSYIQSVSAAESHRAASPYTVALSHGAAETQAPSIPFIQTAASLVISSRLNQSVTPVANQRISDEEDTYGYESAIPEFTPPIPKPPPIRTPAAALATLLTSSRPEPIAKPVTTPTPQAKPAPLTYPKPAKPATTSPPVTLASPVTTAIPASTKAAALTDKAEVMYPFEEFDIDEHIKQEVATFIYTIQSAVEASNVFKMAIRRNTFLNDIFNYYKLNGNEMLWCTLRVEYDGEIDEDNAAIVKDCFTTFWKKLFETGFHGEQAKVPKGFPKLTSDEAEEWWKLVGTILCHYLTIFGKIPTSFCRSTLMRIVNSTTKISEAVLLNDLFLHVTPSEAALLRQAISDFSSLSSAKNDELIDLLCHYDIGHQLPSASNIKQLVLTLAKSQLIDKPYRIITYIREGIPTIHFTHFWSHMTIEHLTSMYSHCAVDGSRLAEFLVAESPYLRSRESKMLYFLKTTVANFDRKTTSKFLHFVTGSDTMPSKDIMVKFLRGSGYIRAHLCDHTVGLPLGYETIQEFEEDLINLIRNEDAYTMVEFTQPD